MDFNTLVKDLKAAGRKQIKIKKLGFAKVIRVATIANGDIMAPEEVKRIAAKG